MQVIGTYLFIFCNYFSLNFATKHSQTNYDESYHDTCYYHNNSYYHSFSKDCYRSGECEKPKFLVNIYGCGASVAECYGTIISQDTVLTASPCVSGFKTKNIHVCTKLTDSCPQNPRHCFTPKKVLIYKRYLSDLLHGDLSTAFALLKFDPFFFKRSQVGPFDLSKTCQCRKYADSLGASFDCMPGKGLARREMYIDDFTWNGKRYGCTDPFEMSFFTIPTTAPYECIDKLGAPLIANESIIGMKMFCQKRCNMESYSVFACLIPFDFQFVNFEQWFIDNEVFKTELKKLSFKQRINLRRTIRVYDELAECPRKHHDNVLYIDS